eukprot:365921-Chlamydomonas_euryale.AAC.2
MHAMVSFRLPHMLSSCKNVVMTRCSLFQMRKASADAQNVASVSFGLKRCTEASATQDEGANSGIRGADSPTPEPSPKKCRLAVFTLCYLMSLKPAARGPHSRFEKLKTFWHGMLEIGQGLSTTANLRHAARTHGVRA